MWPLLLLSAAGGFVNFFYNLHKDQEQKHMFEDQMSLNEDTANKNYNLQVEQFNYQKELNKQTQEREDNAMQRAVADAQKAGLSPLAVTGGSSSTPLTSANAPQMDLSGINTAFQNMIGAYNDMFNRRQQRQQFALQSSVQSAQAYTQIKEAQLQQKYLSLETKYIDEKLNWEKTHGFRDLDWKSELLNLIEKAFGNNSTDTIKPGLDNVVEGAKDTVEEIKDAVDNFVNPPAGAPDPITYGVINPTSKYGHMLDNDNYDNSRSSAKMAKEELTEKYYKNQIKNAIKGDNRYDDLLPKLYKTDDYLKKHISLENWKKATEDFISYYLKNGYFEGHKKYFD